jgi:transposase
MARRRAGRQAVESRAERDRLRSSPQGEPDGESNLILLPAISRRRDSTHRRKSATHKTDAVENWLRQLPRWQMHFIPTHSNWLNQVERFFAKITNERIRRGVLRSVAQLQQAIKAYIANHNQDPKPFRWTASADLILGKVAALCKKLA